MDRYQEVLSHINNVKTELTSLTDQQRKINHNIESTLNRSKENMVKIICKDYLNKLNTIDEQQLNLDHLLKKKQIEIKSNDDVIAILDNAEKTLNKLDLYIKNKIERNQEKSMITDIMVCYWNAVGIKLQFDSENSSTTLLLTNHDAENELDRSCKIEMKILENEFEIIDVLPKSRYDEMKQIENDVKMNEKGLTILIFKLYSHFVN